MPRIRIPITLGDWRRLTETLTPETTADRPFLTHANAKLQGFLEEALRLTAERDDYQAKKQEATRRINEIVDDGRRLASLMRKALKEDLGADSEELVRFGIQPFRGLKFTPRPSRARKKPGSSSEIPEPRS